MSPSSWAISALRVWYRRARWRRAFFAYAAVVCAWPGRQRAQTRYSCSEVEALELVFYLLRGLNDHRMDLVSRLGAGLRRPAAGHQQHPQALNRTVTGLRNRRRLPASSRPSWCLGVDAVRLPALVAA